ncbi:sec14-like protein 2 [Plakobranchus ocellatus]|uniref:Sec14-like protein 2 n=1 Tax=Plakobranchus ocellatus TaxID=259542 RepID=A0AAV4C734_9GAST|nr:sec14-like protein 2 [Plakobranchus ocellatus]
MINFRSEQGHDQASYKETLLEYIDADQLPKHWGGNCVDEDGDPRCPSKISPGGDVPPSCYAQNDLNDLSGFTEVSIGRGSSHQLEIPISLPGSIITWQFKTDGFDIGFGVYKRTCDQRQKARDMEAVLELGRVNSHMVPEDGSVQCLHTGTCELF